MVLPVVLVDLLPQATEGVVGAEDGQVTHVGQEFAFRDVQLQLVVDSKDVKYYLTSLVDTRITTARIADWI